MEQNPHVAIVVGLRRKAILLQELKKPTVARCSPGMFRTRIDGHFLVMFSELVDLAMFCDRLHLCVFIL